MAESHPVAKALKDKLGELLARRYPQGSAGRSQLEDDMHLCGTLMQPADGRGIDAHGITKLSVFANMDHLVDLLTNGVDSRRPFSTAPLGFPGEDAALMGAGMGTSSGGPYTHGPFIVISDPGKFLGGDAKEGHGVKAVLVNPAVGELVPELQKHFPQMTFVTYDKVNDYLFSIGRIDASARDAANRRITGSAQALRDAGVGMADAPKAAELAGHDWKIHSYNAGGGKRLSMTLSGGDTAGAKRQLLAEGVGEQDIISRDGSRLLVMSGSEQAAAAIRRVAAARGVDTASLLRQ